MKSMKRMFGRITIALMLCAMMPLLTMPVCAVTYIGVPYNGLYYTYTKEVDSNNHEFARIIHINDVNTVSLEIPETLDNLPVEIIGNTTEVITTTSDLKKITIPDSVKRIEKDAFRNQSNLETIIIGHSGNSQLKYVGRDAFLSSSWKNRKTKSIKITATSMPSLDDGAFYHLDELYVPSNLISQYISTAHYIYVHSLDEFTGSMFSTGNVIIIAATGVIAIAAIVLLVVRKKKKNA